MNKMFAATSKRFVAVAFAIVVAAGLSPAGAVAATDSSTSANCHAVDEPLRRRPGEPPVAKEICEGEGLPPANWSAMSSFAPVPDRWRIVTSLGYPERWWDPYNGNNVLKGDRPAFGDDWFVALNLVSDTTFESREIPTPVPVSTSTVGNMLDLLGDPEQSAFTQNFITEFVLYKGETVFKPPDYEIRFIPVFNFTRVEVNEPGALFVNPELGTLRNDNHVGIQGLFIDKHLRNVGERYDVDSLRLGIQPITADFRGFLFQDSALGVRLFGTRDNNLWQYNLGLFRRIEKDTNSGLNDLGAEDALRDDYVFLFNVYRQDLPVLGFTSQLALVHNRNREDQRPLVDANGFKARPSAIGRPR